MSSYSCAMIDTEYGEHVAQLRERVEARLDVLLPEVGNERDLVAAAMREGALAPGKRLRPLLLMMAASGLGAKSGPALDLGCAVEMVHAASLVLDDMPCMDNAQLRRGRATVHRAFGEDVAILAAIALLSRAFGLVASLSSIKPLVRTQLVEILANAIGAQGLACGQLQDLRDGQGPRTADQIATTNELKTGVLFSAIMDMAYLISDAPEPLRTLLQGFALELGQAFQLHDDLQDHNPESAKDQGKDDDKSTFVALYGQAQARERLKAHLASAQGYLRQAYSAEDPIAHLLESVFGKAS
ncbi:MAG: polyprenyl synthetase family protein [Janthinobacterium lividum]